MVELLAPAGDYESYKVALHSKADAIYLAGKKFGARANASNFTNEELIDIIKEAHFYDVKIYVTINTICFDEEIAEAIEFIDFLYLNDCDAIIVQDLGLINIIRIKYPELDIHASTQMNIHNVEGAMFLKNIGVKRIILARETSIDEIKEIIDKVKIEVEVFAHGALCYCYSGDCYFSSIVGKRSGNRGLCAQPCRMLYELDGKKKYLMNMKDLNTLEDVDKLCAIGITSFKIEGRLRKSEYVYVAVNAYRQAIDAYYSGKVFDIVKHQNELMKVFSRDFTKGNILKADQKINFTNPRHMGLRVGEVIETQNEYVYIEFSEDVKNKDSLRIVTFDEEDAIIINDNDIEEKLRENNNIVKFKAHNSNLLNGVVYKTSDYSQTASMQELLNRKLLVDIKAKAYLEDDLLCFEVTDGKNTVKEVSAEKVQLSESTKFLERLAQQLNKTQSANFLLTELKVLIDRPVFMPIGEINQLRRNTLEKLKTIREQNRLLVKKVDKAYENKEINANTPNISFIAYTEEQFQALFEIGAKEIYLPFELYNKFKSLHKDINIFYLEDRINPKTIEDDSSTMIQQVSNIKAIASSVYLNVSNIYAVNFLHNLGIKTVGLSIELSKRQILDMVYEYEREFKQTPSLAVMVYGRYSLMISKNCFVKESLGCNNCKNIFSIKDRKDNVFPVIRNSNCILEILNSKRLHLLNNLGELLKVGINKAFVCFTIEDYQETKEIATAYLNEFNGISTSLNLEDITFGYFNS